MVGRARAGWCWSSNSTAGGNDRYAVKRYRSEISPKKVAQKRIRLESLNPEYPSWDLDPDPDSDEAKYRILAEFVRVLD